MASDFAPVAPQYLNLADIYGQAEAVKTMQMRQRALQSDMDNQSRLQGLFRGGQMPDPAQVMAADPHMGMQYQRTLVDKQNANTLAQREDQDLMKQVATNAMIQWKATGNNREAWPAIMHEARKQLNMMSQGRLGQDTNIEQFTPEMVSQFAGWQDPDQVAQRQAQNAATAEGLKAEAKAKAEFPYDVAREQAKPPKPAPAPRPPSPLDQERLKQLQEKKAREESERQAQKEDALANIDDTIAEFERLKELQAKTDTGPISGSAPVAWLRKAGPNEYTGGDDLALLEKGYNTLAVKAIAAFRAGGVTFGQLSNKEGEWVKSTTATINSSEKVNKETLEEGLRLLRQRRDRAMRHFTPTASQPSGGGGYTQEDLEHTAQKYGMSVEEARTLIEAKMREMQGAQ